MNKRTKVYTDSLQTLKHSGWEVNKTDSIKFNDGGSNETSKHLHAKLAAGKVLKANDYRIDTEVIHPERGEIDIVAIPTQDNQKPFAVEVETSPTKEIVKDKLSRYVTNTPLVECYIINLNRVPIEILEMEQHIADELGLHL